jgi:hypothetical protein
MTGTAKGWRIATGVRLTRPTLSALISRILVSMYFRSLNTIPEVHLGWASQTGTRDYICNTYEPSTNDCKITSGDNGIAIAPRLSQLKSDLFCILPQSSHL